MAQAYKCDLTGETAEGCGVKQFTVDIAPGLRLSIVPHRKISERQFDQGEISPAAVGKITAALTGMGGKGK